MSRALLKYVRVSPLKARMIATEVQGMNAEMALASLDFMPNKAAGIISKVIASAVANGEYEPEEVVITSCRVDKAAYMKRWRPRARGSASRILKPTSHILVEVGTEAEANKAKEDAAVQKAAKAEAKSKGSKKAATAKATKVSSKKSTSKADAKKASTTKAKSNTEAQGLVDKADTKAPAKKPVAKKADAKTETKKPAAKKVPAKKTEAEIDAPGIKPSNLLDAPKGDGPDNLTKIKGVGTQLEKSLHKNGIFHFEQIAAWDADNFAWFDANIAKFKGRAVRDDWKGQAKTLAEGGETEFSQRVEKGEVESSHKAGKDA